VDCDQDVVLLKVENVGGAACHNGYPSCFYRKLAAHEHAATAEFQRVITFAKASERGLAPGAS
jgi:hypothetical protein